MMTETSVTVEIKAGCYDTLPNRTLNEVMYANAQLLPDIAYTAEEQTFAEVLQQNIEPSVVAGSKASMAQMGFAEAADLAQGFQHIPQMFRMPMPGSSDIGDVSWITPMGQIMTTCAPSAVQLHTWQATASFGSSIGVKGMHYAAKIMAGAVLDSFTDPSIIQKAREEFDRNRAGITYKPAIPDDVQPPKPIVS